MSKEKGLNLYQKLLEIRRSVPYLQKTNKGHQYNYVSSSDVIGAVREKMDSLGILLTPKITETKMTVVPSGNRNNIVTELFIDFVWRCVETGEESVVPFYAQGTDPHEKGVGKALTYAEKYLLLKQFNIATDNDDPDFFQQKIGNAPNYITSEQVQELKKVTDELAKSRRVPPSNVLNSLGINSFERITVDNFYPIRNQLSNWMKKVKGKGNDDQGSDQNSQPQNNQQQEQVNQQQNNAQENKASLDNGAIGQLNSLVNEIANVRSIDPQNIVNALALNKNFNELNQNKFNEVRNKLNDWLTKAKGGANNTQSTNNAGQQNTLQNNSSQNAPQQGNAVEFVLINKKEEKVPSGELIIKLMVEGRDKPIFARTPEAMNQTNAIKQGDKFVAQVERMGNFTFVTSVESA